MSDRQPRWPPRRRRPRHPSRPRPRPSRRRPAANSAPWRFTPSTATNTSPGRRSAVASVRPVRVDAAQVAARLAGESGGEFVQRVDRGMRPAGARGAGWRARRSPWRINPLIRRRVPLLPPSHRRPASAHGELKAAGGTVCVWTVLAFIIGVVAPRRGARRVDRAARARPPGSGQEVRRARRPVHDRLRPDAVVAAHAARPSTASRRSRWAATSPWRACTLRPPSERELAAAGHRGGRAGGGFFATMVQDARTANDETLMGDEDEHVFYKLPSGSASSSCSAARS